MKTFKKILFGLGVILLGITVFGLFKSMRNPELYTEKGTKRLNDITIPYPEIKKDLERKENESDKEFAIRVNKVVNNGFVHYWKEEGITKYNFRVPIWENYMLFAASFIDPEKYSKYEFSNYKKNLERGAGLCSTHSTVVKGVLNDYGIQADLLDIAGHVVVSTKVGDDAFILDPDYGIYVPHDIASIEANPEIVRPYYKNMADLYKPGAEDPYTTDIVVDIYGKEGNHIYTVDNWFEYFSYVAIWIIPLFLMLPFAMDLYAKSKKAHPEKATLTM